ncbi:hypothetical protein ACFOON_07565 [Novosphingobium piscinae]|uniref:Uncharacterized protein n=1 Tax=Novosphingobium piscinae TaxID=1507448 RepID=A0A7X1KQ19_9SPHN|nr:hypothetical protein [Novosphingobium piscinae]MBC2669314.1 hypothetical protein [Novosphingobium piscinae]
MKTTVLFLLAAATLAGAAGAAGAAPKLTPEQQLAKALEGRVAGKPVRCIDPRLNMNTQVIDGTAIVYGSGQTIYLQKPVNAQSLRNDVILVADMRGGGQLCNIDVVQLHDRINWWWRGFVSMNQFVPYTKVQPAG